MEDGRAIEDSSSVEIDTVGCELSANEFERHLGPRHRRVYPCTFQHVPRNRFENDYSTAKQIQATRLIRVRTYLFMQIGDRSTGLLCPVAPLRLFRFKCPPLFFLWPVHARLTSVLRISFVPSDLGYKNTPLPASPVLFAGGLRLIHCWRMQLFILNLLVQ